MLVASNTSPISNLAIIGRLKLLQSQFGEVRIPAAVKAELDRFSHPYALESIQQAIRENWLRSQKLHDDKVARLLDAGLDPGEAEAIALALEISADLILLDERDGRIAAERAGLRVTGVLGVLLRAKRDGQVQTVKKELDALRTAPVFFVSPSLEAQVLEAAGE